ncbi:MAG: Zn-ribbon domain-containing OB-fold protein [Anaerolineae bacterium]|jgi:hypothetical protein
MNSIPRNWRLQEQRYRLIGEICEKCSARIFPPRDVCPECETVGQREVAFSGRGEVYSFSTVYHPPRNFEEFAPYTVALVQLEEGPMVTAQLTDVDTDEVEIGMPVEMVTRRMQSSGEEGAIIYGYKFRPAILPSAA